MNKKRVADLIMEVLHDTYGVKYISLITGNGALVLNDALAKNKNIEPICVHHEQDAGYIALGYSKYSNGLSVVTPTTGCAGTNCITPLLAAFQDHTPVLFISGNVASNQTTRYQNIKNAINLKKLGTQEVDIKRIVQSITKYASVVFDKNNVIPELHTAIKIATTPPFGPVWLDIPSDVGSAYIEDVLEIKKPTPKISKDYWGYLKIQTGDLKKLLNSYERPLILGGNGIRLSDSVDEFRQFVEKYELPCVFTYGGMDILAHDHPLNIGRIGVKGDRAGNFAVQNCDLFVSVGCCLNVPQVGYDGASFAKKAFKVAIDLDVTNHKKQHVKIDRIIFAEIKDILKRMNGEDS